MSERTFRIAAMVSLSLLTIAWFISLPIEPFVAPIENNQNSPRQSVIERVTVPPSWNDILVVWLTVKSPSIQQLSGSLVWTRTTPQGFAISYRLSFMALADGQMHRYIIPVGTHSKWRDAISDVRLSFPPQIEQDISISDIQIIKRSLWALDSLLGWTLAPYLPFDPPWSNLVLLVGVLLASCLAVVCPWYHWQMRLGVAYGFIGITSSVIVIISFISTLNILLHVYGPLDDQTALTHVPSNDSSAQLSPVLIAAATEMPDGPILMVGFDSESDLVYRARALLYPRPVASINLDDTRAIQEVLRQGYVGVIQQRETAQPPLPGWQQLTNPATALWAWHAPGSSPAQPRPLPGRWSIVRIVIGMALVLAIGAGVASLIGWCDWERWAYSWPLGVSLLGWWMFVLSLLGIRWSWWSIGLPLAIGAGLLAKYTCSHWSTATFRLRSIYLRPSWELGGILILCFLITCLILQTTLLPFTDRDTWRVWGLKGQGFYLDGSVTPVLAIADLSRYSPTQPLVQAWGYITMDGISERLVKIIFPLWYIACIGMIWVTCRHWQSAIIALGWTLLLATTPVLLDHATLGNADLPLAAGLLVSALTLCRWIESCSWRWLIGSAVGIAGASWIKLNGAFIGIWMLGVAVMIRSITSRRWEKKSIKSILLISFVSLGICFALIAPLGFYAWNHGFHSDIEQSYLLQGQGLIAVKQSIAVMSEEFILSPFNSAMGLLGGGYGVLWIVCGSILLSNWRRLRHDRILCFLLLAVVGGIIFYLAIFTFNTAYFTSAERYLLHIAPLAVLAAARSTCLPELAFPLIRASATHAEGV